MKLTPLLFFSLWLLQSAVSAQVALEELIFSAEELPANCKIRLVTASDTLPCELKENPSLLINGPSLDCFARSFVRDSVLLERVNQGLFSVYEADSELGVFAIATDSDATTQQIIKQMMQRGTFEDGGELMTSGRVLVWLWHDRSKPKAYDEFKRLILERLE